MTNNPVPPPAPKVNVLTPYTFIKKGIYLKVLLYGMPGTGKTAFAAGSQKIGKTLFLNVEGGMLSAADDTGNIIVFDIANRDGKDCMVQLEEILWILVSKDTKTYPWLEGLKTVVLDSGSEFFNLSLEAITTKASKKNSNRDKTDIYLEDYGKATSKLTSVFRMIRDLPYNVVVTALTKEVYEGKDDNKELIQVRPAFTAKLGESIMGFFDMVWHSYTTTKTDGKNVTQVYQLLTAPSGFYRAKTRGTAFPKALGQVVVNPQFDAIYNLLQTSEGHK